MFGFSWFSFNLVEKLAPLGKLRYGLGTSEKCSIRPKATYLQVIPGSPAIQGLGRPRRPCVRVLP